LSEQDCEANIVSETYRTLTAKWGVLMNYEALGQVMGRSPDGLRLSLARGQGGWVQQVNAAKVRIGRRVMFRTEAIAALVDGVVSVPGAEPTSPDRAPRMLRSVRR
jgi:hypothetical protein